MSPANAIFPGLPIVESPLFGQLVDTLGLTDTQRSAATQLHERGYALIDFPDPLVGERIDRIKARLAPVFGVDFDDPAVIKNAKGDLRVQDAWQFDEDVRAIAANAEVLDLLSALYGRRAFPFQTLNFPVGTQQNLHSDSIHFSSIPERFMCGVWLAFEDVSEGAGPLEYLPGSHKWPIVSNEMIGRRGEDRREGSAQDPFEQAWQAMVAASGLQKEQFLPRKGQALIWAANLLHGGSLQTDPTLTRWSQVTHYYFDDCVYYTPAFSNEAFGELDVRSITNIATGALVPNLRQGQEYRVAKAEAAPRRKFWKGMARKAAAPHPDLPTDFDAEAYYQLNPDVAKSGVDAAEHYLNHGRGEKRLYRRPLL
ncbi:phytanoyl-CoA dioxygenase family protein [Sphingomonas sp. LY160]|uniref:phytanoyl-CoA dioxygenase family protein n=1 Tax=Sphingomonas sp. LY160 TaxID=3095342 RepID=UPI002ADEE376|nr:phytanoyl-CoA dioxygenase family protein [Sphingomonas sp. LY160]MEA1072004.1 phytanoyl-CoA dioxygenase family protein [Sphingomonas sp. LY160]